MEHLKSIVSSDRFSTGESNLDLHSRDTSRHMACRPEVVIWPLNRNEVSAIITYANHHRVPVTAWGAGTSLEGNPIPLQGGIVLNFSQMDKIMNIREADFQADVEPGVIYQDLNHKLRHSGLFFPPDPGAKATIGGMIANNASGTRTVRYGSIKDHVLKLVVVMADGEIVETGTRASKTSSGYDLIHLFVGSEGTLGLVVEATVRLTGIAEEIASAIATFKTVENAGKAVFEIMRSGFGPAALELLSPECVELINSERALHLNVSPTLFMEFHGPTKNQLSDILNMVHDTCVQEECLEFRPGLDREERDRFMEARYALGEMIRYKHPDHTSIVLDVAVPISTYPRMIEFARQEVRTPKNAHAYVFGHAGDGNLHIVLGAKAGSEEWSIIEEVNNRIVMKALDMGGTATGEHGVGIGKAKFMEQEHGKALEWMKKIKTLFDPNGILNPGKLFP